MPLPIVPSRRAGRLRPVAVTAAAASVVLALVCATAFPPPALAEERPREPTSAGQGATDPVAPPVDASAARERLAAFTDDVTSFSATFEQTLYDAESEPVQSSTGTVLLKRPGRFVWDYDDASDANPGAVAQTIVADGTRLWLYDRELAQVTVNAIDERVAGTPFVLLMGSAPLDEAYEVTALGESEGVEWLELVPKEAGGDFEALYVGLDEAGLAALELRDTFGQATQILFSDFEANVDVDDAAFEFEVPDGVDVIGLDDEGG